MSRLLDDALLSALPRLRGQEGVADPIVYAKFFFPSSDWTWLVTEGEKQGDDFLFYGHVTGFEQEWGYFTLRELEEVRVNGFRIEPDIYFEPVRFSEMMDRSN